MEKSGSVFLYQIRHLIKEGFTQIPLTLTECSNGSKEEKMNIRSFQRLLLSFLGVILITCCINTFTINAEVPDVEVLIEGLDEEPTTRKIGEYTSNNSVELWHYSGGCMLIDTFLKRIIKRIE